MLRRSLIHAGEMGYVEELEMHYTIEEWPVKCIRPHAENERC